MSDIPSLPQTFDPNGGIVSFGTDEKLFVTFVKRPIMHGLKSQEAGRPIYEDVIHVRIQQPGERDILDRPMHNGDKVRFARQWNSFQLGEEQRPVGSPLEILFPRNPSTVETLKFFKVFVVEQLADLSDSAVQNLGLGGGEWRKMAKEFLAAADKGKDYHAVIARIEALELSNKQKDEKIAALETELAEIDAEEQAPPQRRRGRPPRNPAAA